MINGEFIKFGQEGILYKYRDNTILKVFYKDNYPFSCDKGYSKKLAENEFNNMFRAFELGLNVPEPYEILTITLDYEDLKKVKNRDLAKFLAGEERFAIKREFIPGKTLYERLFPSKKIKQKIRELHDKIEEAGLVYIDIKANNYIFTPEKDVYIIDCQYLIPKDHIVAKINLDWKIKNIPTCKVEEWIEIVRETLKLEDTLF